MPDATTLHMVLIFLLEKAFFHFVYLADLLLLVMQLRGLNEGVLGMSERKPSVY